MESRSQIDKVFNWRSVGSDRGVMKPYYQDEWVTQHHSDALTVLSGLESDSVDLLCTDPPYGISFMGKDWDKALPNINIWRECLRVLKPGAFAFVMSIPRSDCLSRMIISLEDAGFRTNFTPIYWAYASGFPKAQNIGKAVDKRGGKYLGWFIDYILDVAKVKGISRQELTMLFPSKKNKPTGWLWNKQFTQAITIEQYNKIKDYLNLPFSTLEEAEREVVGQGKAGLGSGKTYAFTDNNKTTGEIDITAPSTPQAKALDGSYGGFQPKPAVEVIIVCMKPLSEKTFVDQALKNRKGITWLDSVRIPYEEGGPTGVYGTSNANCSPTFNDSPDKHDFRSTPHTSGRFPANLLVSDDVLNDGKVRKSGKDINPTTKGNDTAFFGGGSKYYNQETNYGDSGSFSRYFDLDKCQFFLVPKASKSEKNKGLDGGEKQSIGGGGGIGDYLEDVNSASGKYGSEKAPARNNHPCVKPLKLMSYLITLGSRAGDVIIDPFGGSGTTALASKLLGRKCITSEIEESYCEIAANRCRQQVFDLTV